MPQIEGNFDVFYADDPNVPIPGYLFSMILEQDGTRQKVKPKWQVDICIAVPDHRRGGGQA